MDDLISRQAAIDRINKQREYLQPDIYPQDKIGDAAYRICAEFIERLPSAQSEPHWIPVSERLPEENVPVLLGVRFKEDFKFFVSARIDYNYWSGLGREIKGELRWLPLPSPYRAERRTDAANDIT